MLGLLSHQCGFISFSKLVPHLQQHSEEKNQLSILIVKMKCCCKACPLASGWAPACWVVSVGSALVGRTAVNSQPCVLQKCSLWCHYILHTAQIPQVPCGTNCFLHGDSHWMGPSLSSGPVLGASASAPAPSTFVTQLWDPAADTARARHHGLEGKPPQQHLPGLLLHSHSHLPGCSRSQPHPP